MFKYSKKGKLIHSIIIIFIAIMILIIALYTANLYYGIFEIGHSSLEDALNAKHLYKKYDAVEVLEEDDRYLIICHNNSPTLEQKYIYINDDNGKYYYCPEIFNPIYSNYLSFTKTLTCSDSVGIDVYDVHNKYTIIVKNRISFLEFDVSDSLSSDFKTCSLMDGIDTYYYTVLDSIPEDYVITADGQSFNIGQEVN